jgi:hypothetical protein
MARVLLLRNQPYDKVYVVDRSVGPGGTNVRGDVLLVQYFLRVAMENGKASKGFVPPGEKPITIDGQCGGQTNRYIKFFQEEARRRGAAVKQDGVVDPVVTGTVIGSISQSFYTIVAMNSAYRGRRSDDHDIASDPLFPLDLTKELYIKWV